MCSCFIDAVYNENLLKALGREKNIKWCPDIPMLFWSKGFMINNSKSLYFIAQTDPPFQHLTGHLSVLVYGHVPFQCCSI